MKKIALVVSIVVLMLISAAGGLLVGYQLGMDTGKNSTQTFYATIDSVNGAVVQVTGLEINDINFRWRYDFSVADDTKIIWRYTELDESVLKAGQRVAITFDGSIQETDPAGITHVNRIVLLDDTIE